MSRLLIEDWHVIAYADAHARQVAAVEARRSEGAEDRLYFCEHPAVVTLGRKTPADAPRPTDIPVVEVERGGEATWHGPGQLVGYPIVDLRPRGRDVHVFLRGLEQALADACTELGVPARPWAAHTGLFVEHADTQRKVASIGIAVRHWITWHGFSVNLDTHVEDFAAIRPCGFEPEVMASLAEFRREAPDRDAAARVVANHVAAFLDLTPVWLPDTAADGTAGA